MDILTKIENMGYVIILDKGTRISEPAQSLINKKIHFIEFAYSSKDSDYDFLEEVYKTLTEI